MPNKRSFSECLVNASRKPAQVRKASPAEVRGCLDRVSLQQLPCLALTKAFC